MHASLVPQFIAAKATCSELTFQLYLILAGFADCRLRYSFLSSSFLQILHSQFSHPVNSVEPMINYVLIGLLSGVKYVGLVFINYLG
jgi:hypothetical protein